MKALPHTVPLLLVLFIVLAVAVAGCYAPPAVSSSANSTDADDTSTFFPDATPGFGDPDLGSDGAGTFDSDDGELPSGVEMVAIPLVLPAPAFRGTPKKLNVLNVEKPRGKPRDLFKAPEGTANLAIGKSVASGDPAPSSGELDLVTDGDKEATDFGCLELHASSQWVQVDLEEKSTIWAVVLWHNHAQGRVYHDVVVQVSDDPDFLEAITVFNNDYDNSSGLGIGSDMGYVETNEGKLINCQGYEGRYVRLYSNGNDFDPENHYTEVEVYGIPVQ